MPNEQLPVSDGESVYARETTLVIEERMLVATKVESYH